MRRYLGSKESVLDIKAVDQNGVLYDIEMQIVGHGYYGKRALYYLAKLYTDQLEEGAGFVNLNRAIGIHLLDFDLFPDSRYVRQLVFKDRQTNEFYEAFSGMQLHFVEMAKFRKDWDDLDSDLDRWVSFFNEAKSLDPNSLPASLRAEPAIVRAMGELRRMGLDPREREIYEAEVKETMVDAAELQYAEERGVERGIERGLHMGKEQILIDIISNRLGPVSADLERRLERLSPKKLSELGVALFDLHSYADIEAWLSRQ